ncbi:unnamed protein product [Lathyrus oleraceus]
MLSISQKRISPPLMLPRSAYRGIEREDRGPEQVGLGYRAVSAVGGLQRTCSYGSKKARLDPRRQSLGCSPNPTRERTGGNRSMGDVRVSSQGSFLVFGLRADLSDQGPGHKGPGTIQVRRTPEVTAMSRNLTHRPKRRANTRT